MHTEWIIATYLVHDRQQAILVQKPVIMRPETCNNLGHKPALIILSGKACYISAPKKSLSIILSGKTCQLYCLERHATYMTCGQIFKSELIVFGP